MAFEIQTFGLGDQNTETSTEILGGKGAGLVWMTSNGLPVPPGFIIPTTAWVEYNKQPEAVMNQIRQQIKPYLARLVEHFGYMPLLSVRSGARVSCPGMMDTILNVGLEAENLDFWTSKLGAHCVENSYHRLVTMYGSVVDGIERQTLESANFDSVLSIYKRITNEEFPGFEGQLLGSIKAVFDSWMNERAKIYRKLNSIPAEWGTAVTVQAMVFGNLNDNSGTGVLFTRNPDTGSNMVTGEFLINAQGEDVVAGIRTPMPLAKMKDWNEQVSADLMLHVLALEKLRKDVQDVEFTVQDGKLYFLQTRNAKRSATAAVKIALDMVEEGMLSKAEAVGRVSRKQFDIAQQTVISPHWKKAPVFVGLSACSGVAVGKPVFSSSEAMKSKVPCILITDETTPDDIGGMNAAVGVITMTGGATSHAAVVARGMDKPCVVGLGKTIEEFKGHPVVAFDGATGKIWLEEVPVVDGSSNGLTHSFSRMVLETIGATTIINDVPSSHLDSALLHLGEKVLCVDTAFKLVVETSAKVGTLYLDLTQSKDASALFLATFHGERYIQALVTALESVAWTNKLIILGNVKTKLPRLETGNDIRSVVMAEDHLVLNELDVNDPALAKVLNWKKAEGLKFVSLGSLLEGSLSFMSIEQALQVACN